MNELQRSLARVEELINSGSIQGALHVLYIAQGHAQTATDLISAQVKSMTEQQLRINELTERLAYWEKRARSCEDESCANK